MAMSSGEFKSFSNVSASTAAFQLKGGKYQIGAVATFNSGSVKFQVLGPDGTTYLSVGADFTANGTATVDLAPGNYRFTIATASAVYASVDRIQI